MVSDGSFGNGVFFPQEAYAGLVRRAFVVVIDGLALLIAAVVIWVPLVMLFWDPQTGDTPEKLFYVLWFATSWLYMTVIKRSRFRTIGYRLLGLQIVTTNGERPGLAAMTFRFLMWLLGPFNLLLDLLWLGVDTEQQTLRDCYAGTYVVRTDSRPAGVGPIHLTRYFGAGLAPSYPRVIRHPPQLA